MTTHPAFRFRPARLFTLMAALTLLAASAPSASAQMVRPVGSADTESFQQMIAREGNLAGIVTGAAVPASLAGKDFSTLSKQEWKQIRREQIQALGSADASVRAGAMQSVIYLASFYGDKARMDGAATPLLDTYIFDDNEQHRIMALVGLHAIGSVNALAHLAQRVNLEDSPRVRRMTTAALVDFFGVSEDGYVIVGQLAPAQ